MLKVGIIGLGGIARSHCEGIKALDNVEIVAVADLFEAKRQEYMTKYNIPKGYESHTELLKDPDIDAVGVVLGHQLHHRLTVDALNAGKHVLVEKPMALSLQQCDDMIEAGRRNGVKLMVGYTNHYSPANRKAKEILDSNALGPIMTVVAYMSKNWNYETRRPQYRSRYHGGGMWMTNGVHIVDRTTWFMGSQARSVSASIGTRAHYQAADDYATAFIRYKNGLAGVAVLAAYKDGGPNYNTEIICANGSLLIGRGRGVEGGLMIGKGETWEAVDYDHKTPGFANEWAGLAEAVEKGIEVPTPGEYGRHIMEILLAAEESAIAGKEVVLPSGNAWTYQEVGEPVTIQHGWV